MSTPHIVGILNITTDSFSDGGKYIDPALAIAHATQLVADGADIVDIGLASSHPDAAPVSPDTEIARLQSVWEALRALGVPLSVDSFQPETQLWALAHGADWLNDINGFAHPHIYSALAASTARLVVMHALQAQGIAQRTPPPDGDIWDAIIPFFEARLAALEAAGIVRQRCVLDPGMGFFLGNQAATSLAVLRQIERLQAHFDLPVLVSVSRKSFLRTIADCTVAEADGISLAGELYAAQKGVAYIRTHTPRNLRDALRLYATLQHPTPH